MFSLPLGANDPEANLPTPLPDITPVEFEDLLPFFCERFVLLAVVYQCAHTEFRVGKYDAQLTGVLGLMLLSESSREV